MKKLGIISQNLKDLWSSERGAVAPLVGVCAIISQDIDEAKLRPEAWKYLQENFNGATIDATITQDDFDLYLSDDDMVVTLEARASLPTTFMRIFGHDIMHVAART